MELRLIKSNDVASVVYFTWSYRPDEAGERGMDFFWEEEFVSKFCNEAGLSN